MAEFVFDHVLQPTCGNGRILGCGDQVRQDPLDRRVIGAPQVDGRASWRRIAEVLDAPERTVARRGARLLENGIVTVIAVTPYGVPMLVRVKAAPVSPGPPVPRWRGARRRAFATW
ncbi:AsnC family transcriptional regulator [Amycolatopsis thailandensis]|uniref:AsnC family transcriptional regulator n=1 Tax=Amycolatopsis thailandensis TaxID=589330 RepID=UPI00362C10CB